MYIYIYKYQSLLILSMGERPYPLWDKTSCSRRHFLMHGSSDCISTVTKSAKIMADGDQMRGNDFQILPMLLDATLCLLSLFRPTYRPTTLRYLDVPHFLTVSETSPLGLLAANFSQSKILTCPVECWNGGILGFQLQLVH